MNDLIDGIRAYKLAYGILNVKALEITCWSLGKSLKISDSEWPLSPVAFQRLASDLFAATLSLVSWLNANDRWN